MFMKGTAIVYYTDRAPNRGPISVSIDGRPCGYVRWIGVGSNPEFQRAMWVAKALPLGDHQVVISNVGTGDRATSIIGLDFFEYVD